MSLRLAVAEPEWNEDLVGAEPDELPLGQKLALDLTDAFVTAPTSLSTATRAALQERYSGEQIVELVVGMILRTQNKAVLALGIDYPLDLTGGTIVDDDTPA
ncbi:MAG: hypothetical protein AB7V43_22720 [Acidimicrobiia bacterium]